MWTAVKKCMSSPIAAFLYMTGDSEGSSQVGSLSFKPHRDQRSVNTTGSVSDFNFVHFSCTAAQLKNYYHYNVVECKQVDSTATWEGKLNTVNLHLLHT